MQEETGYSIIFPVLVMQIVVLLQYTLLYLLYQKEIFEKDAFFLDRFMVKKRNLKQCQLYIFEGLRFDMQCIIWLLVSMSKEVFIMLIYINGIGILIENFLYTERYIKKFESTCELIWEKILNGCALISFVLFFYSPHREMGFVIIMIFVIHTIANKIYISSR